MCEPDQLSIGGKLVTGTCTDGSVRLQPVGRHLQVHEGTVSRREESVKGEVQPIARLL